MDLSIIIVNWNTAALLEQCLNSIRQHCRNVRHEIIVVDNASTDGSAARIREHYSDVRLIENGVNAGFAAANNLAAAEAAGRYLLLLNPDTLILPQAIDQLLTYAEAHPRAGVVGPRLLNPDGAPQRSCWPRAPGLGMSLSDAFYLWKIKWLPQWLTFEYSPAELSTTQTVAHVLGACMLIRREVWDKVGPMDSGYFMYLEETDFCFRARQAGWEVVFWPGAEVIHVGQQSSRQQPQKSLHNYYASMYRFCKRTRRYPGWKLALLKSLMQLAVLNRVGLWAWRERRARLGADLELSRNMRAGYSAMLKEIASLA